MNQKIFFELIFLIFLLVFAFYIPTKNLDADQNLSEGGRTSITIPIGKTPITRKIKSLTIIIRSYTFGDTENNKVLLDQNKMRIFNLPKIEKASKKNKNWKFLCNYKNSISNKKLNINLYYKFSSKIPSKYNWYSLSKNNEFIPTFTKKIFKQILYLYR